MRVGSAGPGRSSCRDGRVVDRGAAVGDQPVDGLVAAAARLARERRDRTSADLSENATSPTRSRGDSSRRNALQPLLGLRRACPRRPSSPTCRARARCWRACGPRARLADARQHLRRRAARARACGSAGSTPFSFVGRAGLRRRVGRAEAARAAPRGVTSLAPATSPNASRAGLLRARHPRGVEHDQRVVGEERALVRIDRDERLPPARGARLKSTSVVSSIATADAKAGPARRAARRRTASCRRSGRPTLDVAHLRRARRAPRRRPASGPRVLPVAA